MIIELNDEKLYIIFAQCFDVACEYAMAKMGYTIGMFSLCSYLQFPSKELAQWMQKPTVGDVGGLKRAARYLVRKSSTPTRCSTWISKVQELVNNPEVLLKPHSQDPR